MRGPDFVLFAVGLALFSGSAYGLYVTGGLSGGATSPFGAFTLAWSSEEDVQSLATFNTVPEQEFTLDWNETGATQIVFAIECSFAQPVPGATVAIAVEITAPTGNVTTAEGTCGTPLEVPIVFDDAPTDGGTVQAENAAEAEADAEGALGAEGTGRYAGIARFTSQSTVPVPIPVEVQYSGDIGATITKWAATATPLVR